jgi:glycosyl transferase, family 25
VLILEDDVSFGSVGADFVRELMMLLSREDWDLAFLAYLLPPEDALKDVKRPLTRWPNDVMGAHFYAVNGSFIQAMLQYMYECELRPRDHPLGGPMPADGAHNHVRYVMPNINLFVSIPSLAHQRSSRTDVADPRAFDKLAWLSPILRGLRAIKHWRRMALDKNKLRHLAKR